MLMQPNEPYKQQPTPYDFFLSSGGGASPNYGTSPKKRIMVVAIAAVVLIIIVVVVISLFNNASKSNAQQVLSAVQKQQELIRVAELGVSKSKGSEAANLAITAKLALTTSQLQLIKAVSGKFSEKELSKAQKVETDERLTKAEQASRFDEVFLEVMHEGLAELETTLQSAHEAASSEKTKQALSNSFDQATILLNEPVAAN